MYDAQSSKEVAKLDGDARGGAALSIKHVTGVRMSAEHGTMDLEEPNAEVKVGDKVEWHVGYTDATVVLHETMYGVRNGIVEVEWPIVGRGKLQ